MLDLPLANQTRKHIRGTLNIVLKTARRQKLIQHNPIYDADPLANRWIETGALPLRSCTVRALKWEFVRPDLGGVLVLLAVKEDGTIGEPKGGNPAGFFFLGGLWSC